MNTLLVNPATIVDSRAFIDINLIGVSVFARNNYAYIPGRMSFSNVLTAGPAFNNAATNISAYANVRVQGPGVSFAVGKHAFAVQTGFRTVADVRGISGDVRYLLQHGFQYAPEFGKTKSIKNVRANGLAWIETGLTYGTIISRGGDMITQAAITIKRLTGVAGVGARFDEFSYTVLDSNTMQINTVKGEYAFNDPGVASPSIMNGGGWSTDLGIVFKQRFSESSKYEPHSPCTDGDYRYRFGFSLVDIGYVKFKQPYYRNQFDQSEASQWSNFQSAKITGVNEIDSLAQNGLGISKTNADPLKMRMMLPGGFSAQVDYNLSHGFYVYGAVTGGIPWLNRLGVQRASYLGVAPRWERKRFEMSLPVSLYEFRYPQVGVMLRLNSIIIGSDNLGKFLFKQNMYGADIYISVKYTIFKHPGCNPKSKESKKEKARKAPLECPSW